MLGTSNATRLEIGSFSYGVELGADHAGFKTHLRKGKLVDLPRRRRRLPREAAGRLDRGAVRAGPDRRHGPRRALRRRHGPARSTCRSPPRSSASSRCSSSRSSSSSRPTRRSRSAAASPSSSGRSRRRSTRSAPPSTSRPSPTGIDDIGDLVKFLPPKGIGLALDVGPVKGGGYLYIDAEKGEYAGALELKILTFSIKAIALITTKRPDGSEGWSLLIFVFGQFKVAHRLRHLLDRPRRDDRPAPSRRPRRADGGDEDRGARRRALPGRTRSPTPRGSSTATSSSSRSRPTACSLGPMLELSFSEPPIVYVRLGLIFEVRNALGGDRPAELTQGHPARPAACAAPAEGDSACRPSSSCSSTSSASTTPSRSSC